MRYTVKSTIWRECPELGLDAEVEIFTYVDEDLRMLVAYFYEQHFNKPYDELSWYLEEGAKEFVKEIEDKYWSNEIDSFALSRDENFINFLSEHYDGVDEETLEEELDYFRDIVTDELRDLSLDDLRDLPSWIDYSVSSIDDFKQDTIDIEEFIEEEGLEEDD